MTPAAPSSRRLCGSTLRSPTLHRPAEERISEPCMPTLCRCLVSLNSPFSDHRLDPPRLARIYSKPKGPFGSIGFRYRSLGVGKAKRPTSLKVEVDVSKPLDGIVLDKLSLGVGDRFAHQARPQLAACAKAAERGVTVVPVWNKSNREHKIVGSEPAQTRDAADAAVEQLGWKHPWYVDADHINLETVDRFLEPCDFFTLDVADAIGRRPRSGSVEAFLGRHRDLIGRIEIPGLDQPITITREKAFSVGAKYLHAVAQAGEIYRRISKRKPH